MITVILEGPGIYNHLNLAVLPRVGEFVEISRDEFYAVRSVHHQASSTAVRVIVDRVSVEDYDRINGVSK